MGCGYQNISASTSISLVSVLSRRGSGLRELQALVNTTAEVVSVLSRRGSGLRDSVAWQPREIPKFQSSQGEEVGCGVKSSSSASWVTSFSPLKARKWAAGWLSRIRVLAMRCFSPLKARKWAAGCGRKRQRDGQCVSVLSRRGSGLRGARCWCACWCSWVSVLSRRGSGLRERGAPRVLITVPQFQSSQGEEVGCGMRTQTPA